MRKIGTPLREDASTPVTVEEIQAQEANVIAASQRNHEALRKVRNLDHQLWEAKRLARIASYALSIERQKITALTEQRHRDLFDGTALVAPDA